MTALYLLLQVQVLLAAGDLDAATRHLARARQWVEISGEHVYDARLDDMEAAVRSAG